MTKARILIVEGDPVVARDIRDQLVDLGYEPVADTATGEEALVLVAQHHPDLVLMDIQLAGALDGIATAQIVRERFALPVVFLTAFATEEVLRRAKQVQPFGYIIKPFDERELRTVIEMALFKHDAEARLRESEQKLRMIVEHSTQLFYSHTADNVLTYVSPQARQFLGCEPEEALHRWTDFLTDHPGNAEGIALTRAAIETGQRQHPYELELRAANGTTHWVECRESPVVVDGRTVAIVGSLTEITASKHAQDLLRLQSAALAAAANAIVITDREGIIGWVNEAFSELTGYAATEAIGRNPRDLVKSGQHDRAVYEDLWTTILDGRVWTGELTNRRKDGTFYPEEQTITPLHNRDGGITHFIAIKQDLTERKLVEQMVQASRRQFEAVFQQAAAGMFIADGERGQFLNVNRRFCELVGYDSEELRHLSSRELTHPDDVAADAAQLEQLRQGATRETSREKRFRRKDGSEVWAKVYLASLDPTETLPTKWIGVAEDITERRRAEEELRANEERFVRQRNALITLTGIEGHRSSDLTTTFRQITETAARTLGVARVSIWRFEADRTALRCIDLYELAAQRHSCGLALAAADYPGYFQALAEMDAIRVEDPNRDPRTREFSESYLRPAGITAMLDAGIRVRGAVDGVLCHEHVGPPRVWHADEETFAAAIANLASLALEEWQRRNAEDALRESEGRYRLLFENNPLSMWLYDVETLHFLAVNESAVKAYGYTRAEFLGMKVTEIRPEEDVPAFLKTIADRGVEGRSPVEWRHRRKDGTIFHAEIISRPLVFAGRAARLVLAIDITEKKLLEEKFLHAQRLESIGMLAAGIAHDLNNVLAPIVFAAPMLRESLANSRDLKILETLERSAGRGAALVKQILGFAHSTTGQFQSTQVKHLARDVVGIIEETFPKRIQLEHEIPSNLWPVPGNATQIHQVLVNLCVNARDAMPEGGMLRICASNRRLDAAEASAIPEAQPGAWLEIVVSDTGTGMTPEIVEHIWEPFFTTKRNGKGTGLGLSTVRGIVARHHGFIQLHTAVGRGTTFRVWLPAVESDIPHPANAALAKPPRGEGELILVVDDDGAIRDIVSTMLRKQGYRIISCRDGVEALSLFNAQPADIALVVTDVDMPRLGGVALARALLQLRPDLRLLAMSGLSRGENEVSDVPAVRELAHAFLLKPFLAEDLLQAVHTLLHPESGE